MVFKVRVLAPIASLVISMSVVAAPNAVDSQLFAQTVSMTNQLYRQYQGLRGEPHNSFVSRKLNDRVMVITPIGAAIDVNELTEYLGQVAPVSIDIQGAIEGARDAGMDIRSLVGSQSASTLQSGYYRILALNAASSPASAAMWSDSHCVVVDKTQNVDRKQWLLDHTTLSQIYGPNVLAKLDFSDFAQIEMRHELSHCASGLLEQDARQQGTSSYEQAFAQASTSVDIDPRISSVTIRQLTGSDTSVASCNLLPTNGCVGIDGIGYSDATVSMDEFDREQAADLAALQGMPSQSVLQFRLWRTLYGVYTGSMRDLAGAVDRPLNLKEKAELLQALAVARSHWYGGGAQGAGDWYQWLSAMFEAAVVQRQE